MFGFISSDKGQQNEKYALQVVEHLEDAVVVLDTDMRIVMFNRGAEKIFGYIRDDILGKHLNTLIPQRFHIQHDLLVSEFASDKTQFKSMSDRSRQTLGMRHDGSEFQAQISILRLNEGRKNFFAAVVRDISEKKKNEDELIRLASTDPLTGAFNRREFTALAEREALRSRRYNRPLSVLMLDLDHFKDLNDTYGHAAGDKALQRFTTICCNALRNVDIFGRWGGEEFVGLLPETDAESAGIIGERLRKIVSETEMDFNGETIRFTVSIGVAQFRDGEYMLEGPLSRADAAVYDAKKAGRNNIAIYKD